MVVKEAGDERSSSWFKWSRWHCTAFILAAATSFQVAATSLTKSPIFNEPAHLVAGLGHWNHGDFDRYQVNPPLARLCQTLLPTFVCPAVATDLSPESSSNRSEFWIGRSYFETFPERSDVGLRLARVSNQGFLWLALALSWTLAGGRSRPSVGLSAVALFAANPVLTGWYAYAVPTGPSVAMSLLALAAFLRMVARPRWSRIGVAGLAFGLAVGTKSSLALLAPFLLVSAIGLHWRRGLWRRTWFWLRRVPAYAFAATLALNAVYGFAPRTDLESLPLESVRMTDFRSAAASIPGLGTAIGVALPKPFVRGIDIQMRDFERGMESYLMGVTADHGWKSYYVYGWLYKTPIILLAVQCVAFASFRPRGRRPSRSDGAIRYRTLLISAAGFFVAVSLHDGFSGHYRYSLPAIGLATPAIATVLNRRRRPSLMSKLMMSGAVAQGLMAGTNGIAYFNELPTGMPANCVPLVGSSSSWGQDFGESILQADRMSDRAYCKIESPVTPNYYGVGRPTRVGVVNAGGGSVVILRGFHFLSDAEVTLGQDRDVVATFFSDHPVHHRIGNSVSVYFVRSDHRLNVIPEPPNR